MKIITVNHLRYLTGAIWLLCQSMTASAQLRGSHLLGFNGLDCATQTPPGISMLVLPMYLYHTRTLKNDTGEKLDANIDLTSYANGIGPAWVTNAKILGGNLGGSILASFITNRIEATQTTSKTSYAFSDLFVQPVQLGWHKTSADYLLSYQVYIPTGRYELGGDNNAGLGQWAHELTAGATFKFDTQKATHFATTISYEINSQKKGSDIKTGNNLSIEGGLGHTWYKKSKEPIPVVFNAGLVYYMQFKTTDDNIPTNHPLVNDFLGNLKKDHVYGLGLEGNVFIPSIKSAFVMRWATELGAITRFQGNTFMFIWVLNLKSLQHEAKE